MTFALEAYLDVTLFQNLENSEFLIVIVTTGIHSLISMLVSSVFILEVWTELALLMGLEKIFQQKLKQVVGNHLK